MILARPLACLALAAGLAAPALSQTVLFEEDFNSGLPNNWTLINLADPADKWTTGFGLVNGSGDINHEFFCHFGNTVRNNYIVSPAIDLSGVNNAILTFDQFHDVFNGLGGSGNEIRYNRIEVSTDGGSNFTLLFDYPSVPQPLGVTSMTLSLADYVGESDVRVGFHYRAKVGNDWSIDNVRVITPWEDLGHALAGGSGTPQLEADSTLIVGDPINLTLSQAAPSSAAYLVVGFSELNFGPFYGGTLVPAFEPPFGTFYGLGTTGAGTLPISASWPAGVPSGFELILQYWIVDGGAPFGLSASNAMKGTVP